jgi:predicted phosphodiesterase
MGKKYDPRTYMMDIRPEYKESDSRDMYLDLVAKDAADFIKDYPVIMMVEGNHEYQIRKRSEFDIMKMVTYPLESRPHLMPYEGFVRFQFQTTKTSRISLDMFYTHGTGGNSPVTKGVISSQRRQHDIEADIFVSGHIHQGWQIPKVRRYLDPRCNEKSKESLHVSLGTYKQDRDTYSAMKGYGNVDVGGRKLTFYCDKKDSIKYEVTDVR